MAGNPVIYAQQRKIARLEAELAQQRARTLAAEQRAELATKSCSDSWQFVRYLQTTPIRRDR